MFPKKKEKSVHSTFCWVRAELILWCCVQSRKACEPGRCYDMLQSQLSFLMEGWLADCGRKVVGVILRIFAVFPQACHGWTRTNLRGELTPINPVEKLPECNNKCQMTTEYVMYCCRVIKVIQHIQTAHRHAVKQHYKLKSYIGIIYNPSGKWFFISFLVLNVHLWYTYLSLGTTATWGKGWGSHLQEHTPENPSCGTVVG